MKDESPRDDAGNGGSAAGDTAVTTVGSLMDERRRYEAWLEALNARRAETPKHVFSRVHADYTARLEAVIGRLSGQVEGLRTELTTLATRLATLVEQQHRARDERAEAELRAHVGEMTAAEWEVASAKADAAIAELERQHDEAEQALARTREFLADAERPATPAAAAAPIAAPAPAAAPTASAPTAAASAPPMPARPSVSVPLQPSRGTTNVPVQTGQPSASRLRPLPGREEPTAREEHPDREEAAPAAGARDGGFDELAFLSSVVDDESVPAVPEPDRSEPSAREALPAQPSAPAKVQPVARPAPPPSRNPFAQRAQDKIVNNDGAAGPMIESKKSGGRSGLAANVSGNNPIILRDKSNEAAKTLKCGECGAVNYPTEWYCERCGAELASM
jgi:hypothetical protein